jgi:hypothetical protein
MVGHVLISPEAVLAAAAELDLLAERLAIASGLSAAATHVIPSGVDEVSLHAANHFNKAAITHDQAVAQGILELHHAAAVLRIQLATSMGEDLAQGAAITAARGVVGI